MINLSYESDHKIGVKRISSSQKPKSLQSPSDLKPPTINSSLLSNINPFSDPSIHRQNDPLRPNHLLNGDTHEVRLIDETETKRMKKSNFNRFKKFVFSQPDAGKDILDKKIIHKFISVLKQKAYIYNDYFFNSLQKNILTEKYMTLPNNTLTNNGNLIIIDFLLYFLWDLLTLLQTIILLFWLIFKIAFNSTNQNLSQIIFILFIVLDIFICLTSPYIQKGYMIINKFHIIRHQIPFNTVVNLIYAVSTIVLLFQNDNNEILLILYAFQFISSVVKLNTILNKLSDFTSINFELLVNIGQLLYLLHLSSCIWHIIGINDENSWIYQYNLDGSDKMTRYCHSFYYSISLLFNVGTSNIIITTNTELIYSSVLIFFSIWIFSLILLQLNQYLKQFYEQQINLLYFL